MGYPLLSLTQARPSLFPKFQKPFCQPPPAKLRKLPHDSLQTKRQSRVISCGVTEKACYYWFVIYYKALNVPPFWHTTFTTPHNGVTNCISAGKFFENNLCKWGCNANQINNLHNNVIKTGGVLRKCRIFER